MNAGICQIRLHLHGSQSLKDKRRIVKSIITRLHNQYNVSIAEVGDLDLRQLATLGIACVSNHAQHVDDILNRAVNFIAQNYPEVEIVERAIEILPAP